MNIQTLLKGSERFITDNSPHILTGLGVVGTVTTAVLAAKGGIKAGRILQDHQWAYGEYTFREKATVVWQEFIPAGATGVATVVCIVASNRVGSRRAAALAAAYSLSEQTFRDYRAKVAEKLTEPKRQEVLDEMATERMQANPPDNSIIVMDGKSQCYDVFSDRYFESSMEDLKKAQNDFTYYLNSEGRASLTEYYQHVGLRSTDISDDIGWDVNDGRFDIHYAAIVAPNGKPAITITFQTRPTVAYYRHH